MGELDKQMEPGTRGHMMISCTVARRWATRTLVIWLLAGDVAAAAEAPIRSIEVVRSADAFVANLVMFAPVPGSIAWKVLTDFEHQPEWVPNLRESKVIESDGNALTIEQRGVARFGIASFPYVSVRQILLDPERTVRAKQLKGSMRRVESLMTLTPDGNGTQLQYHLEMVPTGLAAAVLSEDFLQHELTEQFTAIIGEMVRRNR
jgi:polyketide cyclase/dehydrase/lipid transport protein